MTATEVDPTVIQAPVDGITVIPDQPDAVHVRSGRVKLGLKLLPFGVLLLLALVGPWITPYNPKRVVGPPSVHPGGTFMMGTDSSGLDVASRVIAATRVNVFIGVLVTVLATGVGIVIGLLIGMNESRRGPLGFVARGVARGIDLVQAIPAW